jgi:hypothetical protein
MSSVILTVPALLMMQMKLMLHKAVLSLIDENPLSGVD